MFNRRVPGFLFIFPPNVEEYSHQSSTYTQCAKIAKSAIKHILYFTGDD